MKKYVLVVSFFALACNLFALEYGIAKRTSLGAGYAQFQDLPLGNGLNADDFEVTFSGIFEKGWMGFATFNEFFTLSLGYSLGFATIIAGEQSVFADNGSEWLAVNGSANSSSVYQDISLQLDTSFFVSKVFSMYVPLVLSYRSSFYSFLASSYGGDTERQDENEQLGSYKSFGSDIGLGTLININTDNEFLTKIKLNQVSFRMQATYPLTLFYFQSSHWVYNDSFFGKMKFSLDTLFTF